MLDADSHASIYEGAKLSGAEIYRFRHNDPADLDKRLRRLGDRCERTLVIVESLYSMLGDVALSANFAKWCGATARSSSLMMPIASGSWEKRSGRSRKRSASKTRSISSPAPFPRASAASAASLQAESTTSPLRSQIRAYMFTASSTPSVIASTRAALKRVAQGQALRSQLWKNCQRVHEGLTSLGFKLGAAPSPVIASLMDGPEQAAAAWQVLLDAGVYVNLVVPPGAQKILACCGAASAAHTDEQVEQIIEGYAAVAQRLFDQPRQRRAPTPKRRLRWRHPSRLSRCAVIAREKTVRSRPSRRP